MSRRRASGLRVPLGYATGLLVLALARPSGRSVAAGAILALLGEAVRIWASGHIEKTQRLATGGPYAHSRNPLYLGSLLLALGIAVAGANPWVVGAVALYFAAFYPPVMREEGRFLREKFPREYAGWEAAVPLFLPRLTPGGPRGTRFEWARVTRNREWRTAVAVPVVVIVFYARSLFGR